MGICRGMVDVTSSHMVARDYTVLVQARKLFLKKVSQKGSRQKSQKIIHSYSFQMIDGDKKNGKEKEKNLQSKIQRVQEKCHMALLQTTHNTNQAPLIVISINPPQSTCHPLFSPNH